LVRRGLVATREQAHIAIDEGLVLVGGSQADKASRLVAAAEAIVVTGPPRRFVSRGGDKLDGALREFAIDVAGRRALDAGASTGGFVDCLLQRGAARVYAVDVGHGQLDQQLRSDPRVSVVERVNARDLTARRLDLADDRFEPVDIVTADLSFISLTAVVAALVDLCRPGGDLVVLVKPQFEAGRVEVSRGRGVVRDPEIWRRVLAEVAGALALAGTGIMGAMPSPLRGSSGNVEFLLHARRGHTPTLESGALLEDAVARAAGDAR
jgi:23S rRNA (cytidine1920-2'-O)/16S rRNA (cytidine1409-2'-O)-methyltransferase